MCRQCSDTVGTGGPSKMRQANGGDALANELTVKAASKCDEVETTVRTGISLRDEGRHS